MSDIAHFEIPIYDFPVDPEEDDQDTIEENMGYRKMLPFAVIGSERSSGTFIMTAGKNRGRTYPWGKVEVDNEKHCDFPQLRSILLRFLFINH
jgi:cell division control protein 11